MTRRDLGGRSTGWGWGGPAGVGTQDISWLAGWRAQTIRGGPSQNPPPRTLPAAVGTFSVSKAACGEQESLGGWWRMLGRSISSDLAPSRIRRGIDSPVVMRRGEGAQMKWCRELRWSPRVRPVCHGTFARTHQLSSPRPLMTLPGMLLCLSWQPGQTLYTSKTQCRKSLHRKLLLSPPALCPRLGGTALFHAT